MFEFGSLRWVPSVLPTRPAPALRGDYTLHVQTSWRLVGPDGIITGSTDRCFPVDGSDPPRDWDWDRGPNRCDAQMKAWFGASPHTVENVDADRYGGALITLSHGFEIQILPEDSLTLERWRLFRPGAKEHFVVTGAGLDD